VDKGSDGNYGYLEYFQSGCIRAGAKEAAEKVEVGGELQAQTGCGKTRRNALF
jgi:hypothetical protein